MKQYLLHCEGCKHEFKATTKDDVMAAAVEHLQAVHSNVMFPGPALDMLRVHEYATFDYPTRDHQLKPGVPSTALAPIKREGPGLALDLPNPRDLNF